MQALPVTYIDRSREISVLERNWYIHAYLIFEHECSSSIVARACKYYALISILIVVGDHGTQAVARRSCRGRCVASAQASAIASYIGASYKLNIRALALYI